MNRRLTYTQSTFRTIAGLDVLFEADQEKVRQRLEQFDMEETFTRLRKKHAEKPQSDTGHTGMIYQTFGDDIYCFIDRYDFMEPGQNGRFYIRIMGWKNKIKKLEQIIDRLLPESNIMAPAGTAQPSVPAPGLSQ